MEAMRKVELLKAACCVAGAGGQTSEVERRILDTLAGEIGVGSASLEAMIKRSQEEEDYYKSQFRVLKSDPKEAMKLLFSVALADHVLTDEEVEVLRGLGASLLVTEEQFDGWLGQARQYLEKKNE